MLLINLQAGICIPTYVMCRVSRGMQGQEQMQPQGQGMSRGSPAANSLQHAVSSSQPDISTPPIQVRGVYMHQILQGTSRIPNEQ